MITPAQIRIFCRILNAFENDSGSPETDYKSVYVYNDGTNKRKQVTLARGFTDDGGNLKKVIERYIAKNGKLSGLFQARLGKFGKGVLHTDKEFIGALHSAADEPAMREAQDEIFNEVYLGPALEWARTFMFNETLSVGVVVDSFLHSGTMTRKLQERFPEHKPSNGGNEKTWIESYLHARLSWFEGAKGALHNTTYRPRFFLGEIKKDNWALSCPLVANGSKVC
jgi:chitosanase